MGATATGTRRAGTDSPDCDADGSEDGDQDEDDEEEEEEEAEADSEEGDVSIESLIRTDRNFEIFPKYALKRIRVESSEESSARNVRPTHSPPVSASATSSSPPSFSLVDLSLSPDDMWSRFPLFADALYQRAAAYCVEVAEGDLLYLPAGWFHEVRSHGPSPQGHMAFNYWFHPPDSSDFCKPYTSDFWSNDWRDRISEKINKK